MQKSPGRQLMITFSDDALAELRRAVLVEELDGIQIFLNPDR